MKIRNILYGYQYQNGAIIINPEETKIVNQIFNEYLSGKSLLQIADRLNDEHIEYMPDVYGWNKSRIKRLIEDERYLGIKGYPKIIDEDMHRALIQLKSKKNTQKDIDRKSNIFNLGVTVICPNCNGKMFRRHDSGRKEQEWWYCESCRTTVNIADSDFLERIKDLLNAVIKNPDVIQLSDARAEFKTSTDVIRLENEINREFESIQFDKNTLLKKMFECVSVKYGNIDSKKYISEKLKADFANASPLINFSMELFSCTVKAIKLNTDGAVNIILMNDQQIGKEQIDDTNSDKASENCTHNTCTG